MRPLTILGILDLTGAAQSLLMGIALVTLKRGNRIANRMLGALAIIVGIDILAAVSSTVGFNRVFPHVSLVHNPFELAAVPFLYLYGRSLIAPAERFRRRDLMHFLPALSCLIYLVPFYFQSGDAKVSFLNSPAAPRWFYVKSALILLQGIFYLVLLVKLLFDRGVPLSEVFSSMREGFAKRGRYVLIVIAIFWVIGLLRVFDFFGYAERLNLQANLIFPFCMSVLVFLVGFVALRSPEVFSPLEASRRSCLLPEQSERILAKAVAMMEKEKPYKDGKLTLHKLAERLSLSAQQLSQTINERRNQNFVEFINSYRVEEAKKYLTHRTWQHWTIIAIGEEVGFNSKSAFNAVFKKHTNMTPSEYRDTVAPSSK